MRADGFEDITREQVMTSLMSEEPIKFSKTDAGRISAGTVLGYITNQGRFGKLEVFGEANSKVNFQWVTWEADGSTFSGGSDLAVTWTWSADLDLGAQVAAGDYEGPDFSLNNIDGIIRSLNPTNHADSVC